MSDFWQMDAAEQLWRYILLSDWLILQLLKGLQVSPALRGLWDWRWWHSDITCVWQVHDTCCHLACSGPDGGYLYDVSRTGHTWVCVKLQFIYNTAVFLKHVSPVLVSQGRSHMTISLRYKRAHSQPFNQQNNHDLCVPVALWWSNMDDNETSCTNRFENNSTATCNLQSHNSTLLKTRPYRIRPQNNKNKTRIMCSQTGIVAVQSLFYMGGNYRMVVYQINKQANLHSCYILHK